MSSFIKERVEAFDGPVTYLDTYKDTTNSAGKPIRFFRLRGKKKKARQKDNIHLSPLAVQSLMAEPVLAILENCLAKTAKK